MSQGPTDPTGRPILFVITGLERGGAETQIVRLATMLRRRGWQVHVLSLLRPTHFATDLQRGGVPLETLGMERGGRAVLTALSGVWRRVRSLRPAVVVSFLFHANLATRLTAGSSRVPVVTSIRNERFGPRWREWAIRLTNGLSRAVVVNARASAERLVGEGVLPASKVHTIPNGIDVPPAPNDLAARAEVRERLGASEDTFLWLAAGRLEEQKGFDDLVRAFALVHRDHPHALLCIAGEGRQREALATSLEAHALTGGVRLLGLRSDMPDLFGAADAFVLSSRHEGMPNVVMEALAMGLPTVATTVGAVEDLIEDGRSGVLVAPRDPRAMADVMIRMMTTPERLRREMGDAGRDRIARNFSVNASVSAWERLLESLAGPGYARLGGASG